MGKIHVYGRWNKIYYQVIKTSGLRTAFTTKHNTNKLLTYGNNDWQNKYEGGGVYQLTCLDCNKNYIGQTDRSFRTWFKVYVHDYQYGNQKSNYAKHLLDNQHTLHSMEDSMAVLHTT